MDLWRAVLPWPGLYTNERLVAQDPSSAMRQNNEYEEQPERDRGHDEQVCGRDLGRAPEWRLR